MEIFNTIIVNPLINVLVAIYQVLFFLGVPYALGFSIIVLTILIRIILYPLISSQLRTSKKMQGLSPHLSNIKELHKGDSKRIQQETMKLYKEHNVNPAAGCLPVLIQLPVFFGLFSVLNNIVRKPNGELVEYINGIVATPIQISQAWDPTFFGIQLGLSPKEFIATLPAIAIAIPIITGLLQFIQSKMMFAPPPSTNDKALTKPGGKSDDFATVFQKQAAYIFPIMIGFFSFTFVVGLSLYWNTFTTFGIIQQYKIAGMGGLEPLWQKARKTLNR